MTWAVFDLFAYERYSEIDFNTIKTTTIQIMKNNRKFIPFESFDNKLLELYKNRTTGETIVDLFPAIIEWAVQQ
jgi:hypothetical protein